MMSLVTSLTCSRILKARRLFSDPERLGSISLWIFSYLLEKSRIKVLDYG